MEMDFWKTIIFYPCFYFGCEIAQGFSTVEVCLD